jgi:hypothetical protein
MMISTTDLDIRQRQQGVVPVDAIFFVDEGPFADHKFFLWQEVRLAEAKKQPEPQQQSGPFPLLSSTIFGKPEKVDRNPTASQAET